VRGSSAADMYLNNPHPPFFLSKGEAIECGVIRTSVSSDVQSFGLTGGTA